MRFVLTMDRSICTYVSDGAGQPSRIGATPPSGAEFIAAISRLSSGGGETRSVLFHFRPAGLSLSRPSSPAQNAAPRSKSKDLVYGQASGQSSKPPSQACNGYTLCLERGRPPGSDRMVGSRARAWLRGVDASDMQSVCNIVLIACWWISWPRLTIFSCQTNTGQLDSPKKGWRC